MDEITFISHYRYSPGGIAAPMEIPPEDVVHFRHGINPRNIRMGLSPLDGVIREIFVDLESSNFVASLLRNMGVPSVVISPKGGSMQNSYDIAQARQREGEIVVARFVGGVGDLPALGDAERYLGVK